MLTSPSKHKQKRALEETKAVIPGLREKITNAREKLESVLVSHPIPYSLFLIPWFLQSTSMPVSVSVSITVRSRRSKRSPLTNTHSFLSSVVYGGGLGETFAYLALHPTRTHGGWPADGFLHAWMMKLQDPR